ncbi:MAG: hypothetical protein HRT47_13140 [Candidatus Caenarcaniphilales bacterium]|nr:hypothetical protein [Candidatus Caenarcaniphilales bacterium]
MIDCFHNSTPAIIQPQKENISSALNIFKLHTNASNTLKGKINLKSLHSANYNPFKEPENLSLKDILTIYDNLNMDYKIQDKSKRTKQETLEDLNSLMLLNNQYHIQKEEAEGMAKSWALTYHSNGALGTDENLSITTETLFKQLRNLFISELIEKSEGDTTTVDLLKHNLKINSNKTEFINHSYNSKSLLTDLQAAVNLYRKSSSEENNEKKTTAFANLSLVADRLEEYEKKINNFGNRLFKIPGLNFDKNKEAILERL